MRVLHITPSSPYGGVQRLVAQLSAAQRHQGIDARALCLYDDVRLAHDLAERNVPYCSTPGPPPSWSSLRVYATALRKTPADVVHLHLGVLWSNAAALAMKRQPWVLHVHTYPPTGSFWTKARILDRVNMRLGDAFIGVSNSVSEAVRRRLKHDDQGRVFTVYNGVEFDERGRSAVPPNPRRPRYGMATRLAPGKGVEDFLTVASRIRALQPDAHFVLAGDGPLRRSVDYEIASGDWDGRFLVTGHTSDMHAFWRSLDVAIFTAPREPFGLALVEPMAAGVPVAGFITGGGSDELLEPGRTAVVAPWGDYEGLAQSCVRLTTDPLLWQRVSAAARREAVRRFSLDRMCEEVTSVYDTVQRRWEGRR